MQRVTPDPRHLIIRPFPHAFSVDDAAYIGGLSFPEEPRSTHSVINHLKASFSDQLPV
jgi:hypothetical protein